MVTTAEIEAAVVSMATVGAAEDGDISVDLASIVAYEYTLRIKNSPTDRKIDFRLIYIIAWLFNKYSLLAISIKE